MVTILSIREADDCYYVRGILDDEDKVDNGYLMPKNNITPERTWGAVIQNKMFEYRLDKSITIMVHLVYII